MLGGELGRHDPNHAVRAALARAVRELAEGMAADRRRRPGDDHGPADAAPEDRPDPVLHRQEHARQVGIDDLLPDVHRQAVHAVVAPPVELDPGDADDDSQGPPRLLDPAYRGLHLGLLGDVGRQHEAVAPVGADRLRRLLEHRLPPAEQTDPGALPCEADRDRATDPRPGAGHQRVPTFQTTAHQRTLQLTVDRVTAAVGPVPPAAGATDCGPAYPISSFPSPARTRSVTRSAATPIPARAAAASPASIASATAA